MKKILIWGTGQIFAMYHKWLVDNFDVRAFITNDKNCPTYLKKGGGYTDHIEEGYRKL